MRRAFIVTLIASMMMGMVGCGNQASQPVATEEKKQETTEKTSEPAKEETKPEKKEEVKLTYWSMWNEAEPQGQVIGEAIKKYMEENPGVKIEVNWQGREGGKVLPAKLAAGEKIDIYDGPTNTVLPTTKEYAADLTNFFAEDYPTTGGKSYEDVTLKANVDIAKLYSNEGELNGAPYQPFVQCIFYNKEHFEKAGIETLPQTWEEFLETCEKLKNTGYAPITVDDAYMVALPGYYLARAKGDEWVTQLVMENKDEMWQDPAVLEMAKSYSELASRGYFHPNVTSNIFPAGQQDLANGGASMYLNATWLVNELMPVTGADFPWGQMQFPSVPNAEGAYQAANYASQLFVINKNSESVEEAFKFVVYMTTGEWDSKLAEVTYGIPAGIDSVWPKQLTDAKDVFVGLEEWMPWSGGLEDNIELTPIIRTAFTELIGGKLTPEQFVQRMVDIK